MAEEVISLAKAKGLYLATAESLTAGLICSTLVDTPGSSSVVLGGINCYQDQIKQQLLGVPSSLLQQQSAVDPEVAAHLAAQVRSKFATAMQLDEEQVLGISSTGIAGPDTLPGKAVGEVYLGISSRLGTKVFAEQFQGSRAQIRLLATDRAIEILREELARF